MDYCNKKAEENSFLLLAWCHQESNRGHKDFQSFALPTELWHHYFLFAGANVGKLSNTTKYLWKKMRHERIIHGAYEFLFF